MALWIKSLIKAYRVSQQLFVQSKMPVLLKRHMLWFFGTNTNTMQKIIKRRSINLYENGNERNVFVYTEYHVTHIRGTICRAAAVERVCLWQDSLTKPNPHQSALNSEFSLP